MESFWSDELDRLVADAAHYPPSQGDCAMPFEKAVVVPLDPTSTFALITQPDRLRRWMAVAARIELRTGGAYRWTVTPGHSAAGTVIDVDPGKRVVFTWGWEDHGDPAGRVDGDHHADPGRRRHRGPAGSRRLTAQQAARHAKGGTTSWTGWSSPANTVTPVPTNGPQRPIRSTNYLVPKQHWPFFSTYCAG